MIILKGFLNFQSRSVLSHEGISIEASNLKGFFFFISYIYKVNQMVKKKITQQIKKELEEKEMEITHLKQELAQIKKDSCNEFVFSSYYMTLKERFDLEVPKILDSTIIQTNWKDYLLSIVSNHDSDLPFFMTYAVIEAMAIPFSIHNAKIFFLYCYDLAEIMQQMRG
jgi:cell shape-determining protein MreC